MDTSEISDTIKARLYDFKYTPFLSSYIFFWLYFNAKLVLIFIDSKISIQEKITLMAYDDVCMYIPIAFALGYTIIFPLFTAGLYYITLQYKRLMNIIKQNIGDVTPIPQKEANEIKTENVNLRIELNDKLDQLNTSEKAYKDKEKSLTSEYEQKEQNLNSRYNTKLEDGTKDLQTKLHSAHKDITDKTLL